MSGAREARGPREANENGVAHRKNVFRKKKLPIIQFDSIDDAFRLFPGI